MFIDLQLHATFLSRLVANATRERVSPPPVIIKPDTSPDAERWALDRIEVLVPGQGDAPAWCSRCRRVPGAEGDTSRIQLIQRVRVRFSPVSQLGNKPVPVEQTRWVDIFLPLELSLQAAPGGLKLKGVVPEVEVPGATAGERTRVLAPVQVTTMFGLGAEALGEGESGWGGIVAAVIVQKLSEQAGALLAGLSVDQALSLDPGAFLSPVGETAAVAVSDIQLAPDRDGLSMVLRLGVRPDPLPSPSPSLASAVIPPLPPGLLWSVSLDGQLIDRMVQTQVAVRVASEKRTRQRTPVSVQISNIPVGALQPYWAEAVAKVPALGTLGPSGGPRRGVAIHVDVGVTARTWQGWCEIDADVHADTHLYGTGKSLVTLSRSREDIDGWDVFGCIWISIAAGAIAGFAVGGIVGLVVGIIVGIINAVVLFAGESIDRKGADGPPNPMALSGGWDVSEAAQALPFGMTLDDLQFDSTAYRLILGGSARLSAPAASAEISVEETSWSARNVCQQNSDLWAGYTVRVGHTGPGGVVPVSAVWLIDPASMTALSASPAISGEATMPILVDQEGSPAYVLRNLSAPRSVTGEETVDIEIAGTDPLQSYHAIDGLVFTGAGAMRFQAPAVTAAGAEGVAELRRWLSSPEQKRFCDTIHHRNKAYRRRIKIPLEDPGWRGPLLWRIAVRGEGPWDKANVVDAGGELFSFGDHLVVLTDGPGAAIGLRGGKGAEEAPLDVMVGRLALRERLAFGAPIQRMALSQRGTRLDVQAGGDTQRFSLHGPAALRTRVSSLGWPAQPERQELPAAAPPGHGAQRPAPDGSRARALRWGHDVIGFRQLIAVRSADQVLELYSMKEVSPQQLQWSEG